LSGRRCQNMFSIKIFALLLIGTVQSVPLEVCIAKYKCLYDANSIINTHRNKFPGSYYDRSCWISNVIERLKGYDEMLPSLYTKYNHAFHKNMCAMVEEQALSPVDDICATQYRLHLYKLRQYRYGYQQAMRCRPSFLLYKTPRNKQQNKLRENSVKPVQSVYEVLRNVVILYIIILLIVR